MRESIVKEKILDVASRLFYQQGYNLTGINQIIEEADIARGSLYNHFDSKTELLLAYLDRAHEECFEEMTVYLEAISHPKSKILGLFDYRMHLQEQNDYRGCQFIKISDEVNRGNTRVFALVEAHKEKFRNYIRNLVMDVEHREVLSDERLTDMIYLLLEGATMSGSIYRNSYALGGAKRIVEELV
jgi:AcrR family transcriptional regulator